MKKSRQTVLLIALLTIASVGGFVGGGFGPDYVWLGLSLVAMATAVAAAASVRKDCRRQMVEKGSLIESEIRKFRVALYCVSGFLVVCRVLTKS